MQVRATVSVGCATAIGLPVAELLTRADHALYEAKARGRNIVVCADPRVSLAYQPTDPACRDEPQTPHLRSGRPANRYHGEWFNPVRPGGARKQRP
jgi:hypothetical protein